MWCFFVEKVAYFWKGSSFHCKNTGIYYRGDIPPDGFETAWHFCIFLSSCFFILMINAWARLRVVTPIKFLFTILICNLIKSPFSIYAQCIMGLFLIVIKTNSQNSADGRGTDARNKKWRCSVFWYWTLFTYGLWWFTSLYWVNE